MTDTGVKLIMARLMTDDSFRSEFSANPAKTMQASGYALDKDEIEALSRINVEDYAITVVRAGGPLTLSHGQPMAKDRKKK